MYEVDYDVAIGLIDDYISLSERVPKRKLNDRNIYFRGALYIIRDRVMEEFYSLPDQISRIQKPSVYDILDNFIFEMQHYLSMRYYYGFDVGIKAAILLKRFMKSKNLF